MKVKGIAHMKVEISSKEAIKVLSHELLGTNNKHLVIIEKDSSNNTVGKDALYIAHKIKDSHDCPEFSYEFYTKDPVKVECFKALEVLREHIR